MTRKRKTEARKKRKLNDLKKAQDLPKAQVARIRGGSASIDESDASSALMIKKIGR